MTRAVAEGRVVSACNLCGFPVETDATVFIKDGHEIARCPSCGLVFRRQLPDSAEIVTLYRDDYFRAQGDDRSSAGYLDYIADEPSHRRTAQARLRLLERFTAIDRLLDVGCAAGFFVDEASKRGWQSEGVDLADSIASWGRDRLSAKITTGEFLGSPFAGPYTALTMWDYLEHTLDPREEIRHAAGLLRSGGVLALSTGNAASWLASISGARWHLLTPRHHNFYFTPETLKRYLSQEGFQVLATKYLWSWYSVAYLAHKLQTMGDNQTLWRASSLLRRSAVGRLTLPVNLWDIVTVIARKS